MIPAAVSGNGPDAVWRGGRDGRTQGAGSGPASGRAGFVQSVRALRGGSGGAAGRTERRPCGGSVATSGRSRGRLRILSSVCRLPGALRVPPHGAVWKQSAALCAVGMRQPLHRAGAGKERARGWRKGGSPQGPCSVPVLFWRATHRKCRRRRKGGVRPGLCGRWPGGSLRRCRRGRRPARSSVRRGTGVLWPGDPAARGVPAPS